MRLEVRIQLAKTLIAFAFVLITTGIFFYIQEKNQLIDPVKDTKVIAGIPKNPISVTPTEEQTEGEAPESETEVETPPTVSTPTAPEGTTSNPPVTKKQNPTPSTPTPSIQEQNAILRSRIQNNYAIEIKYGNETLGYNVGGLGTIVISNPNTIYQALTDLEHALSLYPSGFLKEISSSGFSLTLYLIKNYSSGNVTGVTDSSTNHVVMSIATDFSFAESFHHEMYHYIDDYIYENEGKYTTWDSLNPTSFQYGNVNQALSYNKTLSADAYFVNNYAQTNASEDRASTFEYMMSTSKASCLNYGKRIWLKAKYMADQMDLFFETVSPNVTEYWERYLA